MLEKQLYKISSFSQGPWFPFHQSSFPFFTQTKTPNIARLDYNPSTQDSLQKFALWHYLV